MNFIFFVHDIGSYAYCLLGLSRAFGILYNGLHGFFVYLFHFSRPVPVRNNGFYGMCEGRSEFRS